jgi:hypothetical protein
MPGSSYGLPAKACIAGARLAEIPGSICSLCYALRDTYTWTNPGKAATRRLVAISDPRWVDAMSELLAHEHAKKFCRIDLGLRGPKLKRVGSRYRLNEMGYHRWHDSGDLQSVEHFAKIVEVCRRTPQIKHWLPTREIAMIRAYNGEIPDNLIIRVSATMIDGPAPSGWPHTSTVHSAKPPVGAYECPVPKQSHQCGSCRSCWSRDVPSVSYLEH